MSTSEAHTTGASTAPIHGSGRVGRPSLLGWLILGFVLVNLIGRASAGVERLGDFEYYVEVGELVLSGDDPFATEKPWANSWPPAFLPVTVMIGAVARLDLRLAAGLWAALMFVCLGGSLWLSGALAYGRPPILRSRPGALALASTAMAVPMLLLIGHAGGNLRFLQVNPLVLLLCLAGCHAIVSRRQGRGGALIGAAAALKIMPILFLPYFVYRRWWRALWAALAAGAALSFLPVAILGPVGWWRYCLEWIERTRAKPSLVGPASQSVFAMVDRAVGYGLTGWREGIEFLRTSGSPIVTALVLGIGAAVVGLFVWSMWGSRGEPDGPGAALDFAILLVLMPLLAPYAWGHYFIFMMLGVVVLWRAAAATGPELDALPGGRLTRRASRWLLGLCVILGLLEGADIVGSRLALDMRVRSSTTLSALLVLAGLLVLRRRWTVSGRSPDAGSG